MGDPSLPVEEAARRRDFTINAMLFDPSSGEAPRPSRRPARPRGAGFCAPSTRATFGEDPLRALRAVQLAARFELAVDPDTAALCAAMPLDELPAERVFGEIEKLLLQARRPSLGFALLKAWGMLPVDRARARAPRGDAAGPRVASRGRRVDPHACRSSTRRRR